LPFGGVPPDLEIIRKLHPDDAPGIQQLRDKVELARGRLERIAQLRAETMKVEAELAQVDETEQASVAQQQKERIAQWSKDRVEYEALEFRAESAKVLWKAVVMRAKEVDLTSRNKFDNVQIIDPAMVPIRPVSPRVLLSFFIAILGLGLFLIGWMLREPPDYSEGESSEAAPETAH
jgi:polysaccharide biosynthesis transport protein